MEFSNPFDFVRYLLDMDIETLKFIYPNIYSHNDIFKKYNYHQALYMFNKWYSER